MAESFEPQWRTALPVTILATWPEVSGKVFWSQSFNRENWENLIIGNPQGQAALASPYCIMESMGQVPEDWGTDNQSFRQPVNIYYITDLDDPGALYSTLYNDPSLLGYDIATYVETKLESLRQAMIANNNSNPGYQIAAEHPRLDVSEFNPANMRFYRLQAKKFGGQLSARLLVGDANLPQDIPLTVSA